MRNSADQPLDAGVAALELASALNDREIEYALGGALALSYWAQ